MPGLSGLGNLAYLELSNNQITVISDLSGLSALNNIDLSNNYLTSISRCKVPPVSIPAGYWIYPTTI